MSVDGKEARDENVRYAYYEENGWSDPDAILDESSVIRYQYYEANGWKDDSASIDKDITIREEYDTRNNIMINEADINIRQSTSSEETVVIPAEEQKVVANHSEPKPEMPHKARVVKTVPIETLATVESKIDESADKTSKDINDDFESAEKKEEDVPAAVTASPTTTGKEQKCMSAGQKVAIGVGVGIGVIAVGAVAFFLLSGSKKD